MTGDPDIEAGLAEVEGRTYISQPFAGTAPEARGEPLESMRYASRVVDQMTHVEFVNDGGRTVLHETEGGRERLVALFAEDSRSVRRLTVQRFTTATDRPLKQAFSFDANEAAQFVAMLKQIAAAKLPPDASVQLDDAIESILSDENSIRRLYESGGREKLVALLQVDIAANDVLATGRRKEQLAIFERLLTDGAYFAQASTDAGGPERAWQRFFQTNQWIFGYGLNYIFLDPWDPNRLEQTTTGSSVLQAGKRVDGLLETTGFIRSLCFVEIKEHRTPLLQADSNRPDVWTPSRAAVEAVAQLQRTVDEAMQSFGRYRDKRDADGNFTGARIHVVQPRSFLVLGQLEQLAGGALGTENEAKFRSLELFRRNTTSPEIVTFDELLARAKFIVEPGQ